MSVLSLLSGLRELGVNIELMEGKLKINAPEGTLNSQLIEEIKEKKEEIILFLQKNVQNQAGYIAIEPVQKKEYYPLSSTQRGFYFQQQMDWESTAYNIPEAIELAGGLDAKRLEETFRKLVQRHEALRTSFELREDTPVQRIHDDAAFEIVTYGSPGEKGPPPEDQVIRDFIKPFQLSRAPLLRVGLLKTGEDRGLLLMDMHHIISDDFSHQVLVRDFMALYSGQPLPPLKIQYKDYSEWQNGMMQTGERAKQEAYWLKTLAGEIPVLQLPYDFLRHGLKSFKGRNLGVELGLQETEKLRELASKEDVTLFMLMLTIYNIFLSKLSGQEDIVVGIAVLGRKHAELDRIIGAFINVLPLRNYPSSQMTSREFLEQVKKRTLDAFENQDYQFEEMVDKLGIVRNPGHQPLTDVAFGLQEAGPALGKTTAPGDSLPISNRFSPGTQTSKLDLTMFVKERRDTLSLLFEYCTDLFEEDTIYRFAGYYKQLVISILGSPDETIAHLEIIPTNEREQVLFDFNDNEADFPRDESVHRFIERQAREIPGRIAVVFEDSQLTYRELNERAGRLAAILSAKGINKDQTVGILLKRSTLMLTGILAAWKAGGAYIPIDLQNPTRRIIDILQDSRAKALLTLSAEVFPQLEENYRGQVIPLDKIEENRHGKGAANLNLSTEMHSLAYVIYTSGSTGKPKGVMVEHIGMMNHIQAKINDLQLTADSILAQNASHTFDISVWQFFTALITGGKTIIYPEDIIMAPVTLISRLVRDGVTILEVVPSYLMTVLDTLEMFQKTPLLPLKYLLVTGEEVKRQLVRKWLEVYWDIKIVNAYGPTEASDDITHYIMSEIPYTDRIPIGKPLQNLDIYIIDKQNQLCPIGVKGEICVAGIGVGRGYLNNPELTKSKFQNTKYKQIPNHKLQITNKEETNPPQHPNTPSPHYPIYRTGDLGRWLSDGTIEFFGRKDYQVKIRGFRIELGEIENQLAAHPQINDAVVLERENEAGNKYLCAYVVTDAEDRLKITEVKQFLSGCLPEYMVPQHVVILEEMPLTPNGKIDRAALPEPGHTPSSTLPYVTEKELESLELPGNKPVEQFPLDLEKMHREMIGWVKKQRSLVQENSKPGEVNYYSLTFSQRMIYYTDRTYPETGCQNIAFTVKYPGILDRDLLREAINLSLAKNEGLRLRIVEIESDGFIEPLQYIADYKKYFPGYVDFTGSESEKKLQRWIRLHTEEPFQLVDSDLFYFAYIKFNKKESGYYMKVHHIISDGWTIHLLVAEINRHYENLQAGQPTGDGPNPSYTEYIYDEQEYLMSPRAKEDREFWHRTMWPLPQETGLSSRQADFSNIKGGIKELPFPEQLRTRMLEYGKNYKVSPYKLVLAAFAIYMSRITGLDDVVIGTVNHGRSKENHKRMTGIFISFFPLCINVDPGLTFLELLKQTRKQVNHIIKNYQQYPFDIVTDEIRKQLGGNSGYWLNINLVGHPDAIKKERFKINYQAPGYHANPLIVHVNISNRNIDGILELEWNYQLARFSEEDIMDIHKRLVNILTDALDHPGKKLAAIELVSAGEKQRILSQFSSRSIEYPQKIEIPGNAHKYPYILHKGGTVQPVGVPGELWIGGNGSKDNEALYRTGELARWQPDGNIEFLGSINRQIWLEGSRIHLDRIENLLLRHEDITGAAVVVTGARRGNQHLSAYVTSGKRVVKPGLQDYLAGELPRSMIPPVIIQVEKMPLTPGGEVDRSRLETLDMEISPDTLHEEPQGAVEAKLVEILSRVLGMEKEKIGREDDFFKLGATSLHLIKLVSRIYKKFTVEIPVTHIYYNPTIKDIAQSMVAKNFSDDSVVLLGPRTQKRIFCFPPQIAYGFHYMSLASALRDYSLYAFSFIENNNRIEEYVDIITKIQPVGPYVFLGFSSAGPLTFQVAKALENQGHEVSDIIFIDCLFSPVEEDKEIGEEFLMRFGRIVEENLENLGAMFLKDKVMNKAISYMNYCTSVTRLEVVNAEIHLILTQSILELESVNKYVNPRCWDNLTAKKVVTYHGFGTHRHVFIHGSLEKNAEIVGKILENSNKESNNA